MRNRVVIELVESESMTQNLHLEDFLGRAAQNGIRISLDDFGSGYSNFEYISRIKADFLKIDGAIVRDFPAKKESSALVTAIASFAGQLGISVIAEYVSDERAYSCLRSLGIGYSQGFYFGKPVRFVGITGSTGTECVSLGDVRECPAHS